MEDQQKNASVLFDLMGKLGRLYSERTIQAQKAFMEHAAEGRRRSEACRRGPA